MGFQAEGMVHKCSPVHAGCVASDTADCRAPGGCPGSDPMPDSHLEWPGAATPVPTATAGRRPSAPTAAAARTEVSTRHTRRAALNEACWSAEPGRASPMRPAQLAGVIVTKGSAVRIRSAALGRPPLQRWFRVAGECVARWTQALWMRHESPGPLGPPLPCHLHEWPKVAA